MMLVKHAGEERFYVCVLSALDINEPERNEKKLLYHRPKTVKFLGDCLLSRLQAKYMTYHPWQGR